MCGFVALFVPGARPDAELIQKMTDALAHRGPDGHGMLIGDGFALGHRRLAIIDLEGGHQPLFGLDERMAIVFNGEAYNYQSLQPQLPGPWRTRSDTEVFLRAYETHGIAGLTPLVGMWGAAIWDGRHHELAVFRDRLGVKPVYWAALAGGGWAFASEIKALLQHPGVDRRLDAVALEQLLTYRYVPGPRTPFVGIKKLLPGHWARANSRGLHLERYWAPMPSPASISDHEAELLFSKHFDDAVRLRMVSDVPVGLFLSGGIDSAAVLQAMGHKDIHTFTIGFKGGEADDEIRYAKETAELFGAQSHSILVGPDDYAAHFDAYAAQLEEPVLNDSAMALHFLSQLARKTVKVVLSGQGADEPLAGYARYQGEFLAPWLGSLPLQQFRPWIERLPLGERTKRAFRSLDTSDPVARAIRIYAVFQAEEKLSLLRPSLHTPYSVATPLHRLHAEVPHLSPLGRMLYADTRMWLADDLLLVADKLTMAHGLELRVPFLDHRLIELLESLPDDQKLRLTHQGFVTKAVHRRVMAARLPRAILTRKKRGFTNPMDVWLRQGLKPLVEQRLLGDSPLHEWLQLKGIRQIYKAHQDGADRRRQLFLLLTLDAWARHFQPGPAVL